MAEPVSTFLGVIILNAMVSHAVNVGLGAGIVDKFKALLADDRKTRALDTALKAAADKFRLQHPELAEKYFGEAFLKNPAVLAELTKLLTTTEEVSAEPITEVAWQSTDPVPDDVARAAEDFLRALRSAITAQEVLAPDYDRRLLAETHEAVKAIPYIAEDLRRLREELRPPDEGSGSEPEATPLPELAVREAFGAASSFLLRWPQETGGRWIDRPQLVTLKDTILDKPHSVSMVLGAPGCGKSALLAHLGNELRDRDVALLALKVDEMPRDVRSAADIAAWLETPGPVDQCVRRLADDQLVVLLIDQLDAVGELIDVHTGRLTALLNLVNRLRATPNVHIVMSCRRFDYQYDVRFKALEAEEVTLGDLPWDDVEEVLRDRGVDPSSWSEPARKVLCTPQHLRLFVDHLADAEDAPAFNSYHSMLEAVFSLRFKGPDSQSLVDTLGNIALQMAEYEELWQPRARFDGQYADIDSLIGLGFLQQSADRKQITFTHQTMFDFVRARAFVSREHSLADYVASKHGSLNIRPTLWSALHYLRSADPWTYREQLSQVWKMADLRLHVRLLLISFLGQLPEPDSYEAKLLLPAVDDALLREKVLLAMGNSPGWFKRLAPRLPALMAAEKDVATLTAWLLGRAINFDREAVLDLVEKHWLPDEERDAVTLDVFRDLEDWDDRASAVVEKVVGRTPFQTVWIGIIAERALKTCPACSARIVRTALDRALREEEALSPKEPIPPPEGASVDQEATYRFERKEVRYGRFEKLLRDKTDWYHLHEWSARHPTEFLAELWPWFVRVVDHLSDEPDDIVESYLDSHTIVLDLDPSPEKGERVPVPSSIQAAVIGYAEQAPDEFLEFLRKHQDSDLKPVHMILAQGLEKLASTHPADCMTYLLGNPRRLALGPFSHQHRDSLALISALYPYLDGAARRDVDSAILAFDYRKKDRPDSDVKTRHDRLRWNRQHQLRLLRAIPRELMSEPTRRSYEELERAHPHTRDKDMEMTDFGWVGSPMSEEQMDKAQDDAIINLFNDLTDETEWDNPKHLMRGGSVQASRAFGELAKTDPDRALKLIDKFEPGKHERPVGNALRAFTAEKVLPPETLVDLVHALDARGFSSDEFRWDAADCLKAAAHRMKGLSDETCNMLEGWLIPFVTPDEPDDIQTEDDDDRETSVIWDMGGIGILPHGNYPVLDAIERGFLCRNPKAVDPWLDVLERHLDCPEDPAVWRALADDLRFLTNDDPTRASAFLGRLFEEVPSILQCRAGMVLLANVRWWLPKAITWKALTTVLTGPWDQAAQAVGEILFLCWAFNPEDPEYECLMDDVVIGRESDYIADHEQLRLLRLGVAASAANVWHVPEVRERASHTLNRLLLLEDKGLPGMIMDVFRAADRLPEDEHTQRLLQALPHHKDCLRHDSYSFIKHLKALLANGAYVEEVCAIAETIVAVVGKEIADMRTHWASHGEDLVEIAITLQRFEETRERGLTLFEELMGFERIYLPKLLQEIDRRIDG